MTKKYYVVKNFDSQIQKWNGYTIISDGIDYYACVLDIAPRRYIGIPLSWNKSAGWFPIIGATIQIDFVDIQNYA